jgi:hypothetical protein
MTEDINIPPFEVEDMKTYFQAIDRIVPSLKESIANSKDGTIRVRTVDIARELGMTKNPASIYWDVKFVLYLKGIVVNTGKTVRNEPVLIMKEKVEGQDFLPASLRKIDICRRLWHSCCLAIR